MQNASVSPRATESFTAALRAYAVQDEISGSDFISLWNRYFRHRNFTKAEGAPAHFTVKMQMLVIVIMFVFAVAEFVACASAPVIDDVDQVMSAEKGQGSENAGLIY